MGRRGLRTGSLGVDGRVRGFVFGVAAALHVVTATAHLGFGFSF